MSMVSRVALLGVVAISLVACGSAPPLGSVDETYSLVDNQGRKSGTVVFTPLGQGEVRDSSGKLIGKIVPP